MIANENYEELKNTLSNFIPLNKFSEISSDDFYDKVHPYERIISHQIYDDVLAYHLKGTVSKTIRYLAWGQSSTQHQQQSNQNL